MRIPQIAKLRGDADPADTCIMLRTKKAKHLRDVSHHVGGRRQGSHEAAVVAVASDGFRDQRQRGRVPHPRSFSTQPRVLGHTVRDEKVLTLEDAVRKMTSLPRILGLRDRARFARALPPIS